MPGTDSLCAAFAPPGSCVFYVISPTVRAIQSTWNSAAGTSTRKVFTVKVVPTSHRAETISSWYGTVNFGLKPKAIQKEEDTYLSDILQALQASSGDVVPVSPVAVEPEKFEVLLDIGKNRTATLRVIIRAAGIPYASIPLKPGSSSTLGSALRDLAHTQVLTTIKQIERTRQLEELRKELEAAQKVAQNALTLKERIETILLSKFLRVLNSKKLKIQQLASQLQKNSNTSTEESYVSKQLEDHSSIDSKDPKDMQYKGFPADDQSDDMDDDSDSSSGDLTQSITGTYHPQSSLNESQVRRKRKAHSNESTHVNLSTDRVECRPPASSSPVAEKMRNSKSSRIAILSSALQSDDDSDSDGGDLVARVMKRKQQLMTHGDGHWGKSTTTTNVSKSFEVPTSSAQDRSSTKSPSNSNSLSSSSRLSTHPSPSSSSYSTSRTVRSTHESASASRQKITATRTFDDSDEMSDYDDLL